VSPQFREILRLCGIQRLMQALGFYGFADAVKGNKTFLNHIPAAMTSLRSLVSEIEALQNLRVVLDGVT
jgi:aminoglycoside/choline kinase family phosphotransferase